MGEESLHAVGLRAAAEALDAGHPTRRTFQGDTVPQETAPGDVVLLVGDPAAIHVEYNIGGTVSDTLLRCYRFLVRLHRRSEHIHVYIRRHQVVYRLQIRTVPVHAVHRWCALDYTAQHCHRERRCGLGRCREET